MALPVLTPNSPSAGFIAWTSFSIRFGSVAVTIPAGNTNKRYAYWLWNGGAPAAALQFADVLPANLGPEDLVVFANRNGIPVNITNANVIEGSLIATDSIIGTSISGNTITGDKMVADTLTAREIQANAITANELSISSFGGLQAVNGEMDDVDPATKVPAGWTAGFERAGTAPTYAQETAAPLSGSTSVKITLAANSTEAMAASATPCKAGDVISFGVACRASVVGAPITIRAYFGTSSTFTRSQLVAATPDTPTNVVVYDVTPTGLVARSGQPTPVSGAGIAAPVEGWAAPVTTSLYVVGQVKVPAGATFVRFVLASGLTTASPAHSMVWDSLDYAPMVTSVRLADGAVTADKLDANAINGKLITGTTMRTAAAGARLQMRPGLSSLGYGNGVLEIFSGNSSEQYPGEIYNIVEGSAPGDNVSMYIAAPGKTGYAVSTRGFIQLFAKDADTSSSAVMHAEVPRLEGESYAEIGAGPASPTTPANYVRMYNDGKFYITSQGVSQMNVDTTGVHVDQFFVSGTAEVNTLKVGYITNIGWQQYTPVWSNNGGATLVIGNGFNLGWYHDVGSKRVVHMEWQRGSTSNVGTTTYLWSYPPGSALGNRWRVSGSGYAVVNGKQYPVGIRGVGGAFAVLMPDGTRVANTTGSPWAAGDEIVVDFVMMNGSGY